MSAISGALKSPLSLEIDTSKGGVFNNCNGVKKRKLRTDRNMWMEEEILALLRIMKKHKVLPLLNGKALRNEQVFRIVEKKMHTFGFTKKSYQQIWNKWKFLRTAYITSKEQNAVSKALSLQAYQLLDGLLADQVLINNKIDPTATTLPIITSIQGGYEENSELKDDLSPNGHDDRSNPSHASECFEHLSNSAFQIIRHPIFGYRMALLKNEQTENDNEYPANIHFEHASDVPVGEDSSQDTINYMIPVQTELHSPPITIPPPPPLHTPHVNTPKQQEMCQSQFKLSDLPKLKHLPSIKIALPSKPASSQPQTSSPRVFKVTPPSQLTVNGTAVIKRRLTIPAAGSECNGDNSKTESDVPVPPKVAKASGNHAQTSYARSIKSLATKLKEMQKDLIADFFQKQRELIDEEHRFQQQQDDLLMKSFAEQTKMLVEGTRSLFAPNIVFIDDAESD